MTWLFFDLFFLSSILNLSIDFAGETLSVVRTLKNWLNLVCHLDCNSSALSIILVAATHLEIGHIECLIFKWVAATSLKWYGTGVVALAVVAGQHGPFFGCAVTVNGHFIFHSIVILDNNNFTVEFLASVWLICRSVWPALSPYVCKLGVLLVQATDVCCVNSVWWIGKCGLDRSGTENIAILVYHGVPHMCVSMICYWLRPLMCTM